jgi:hypothetical protein
MPAAPFGAGLPTLSEVVSASFDHLLGAADYYDRASELTENAFTQVRGSARWPGGTEWEGQATGLYCGATQPPTAAGSRLSISRFPLTLSATPARVT